MAQHLQNGTNLQYPGYHWNQNVSEIQTQPLEHHKSNSPPSPNESKSDDSPPSTNRKRKRQDSSTGPAPRTVFSRFQLESLESRFREQSFLSKEERQELAHDLELSERQVMIWFQNRRGRLKKRGPMDKAYHPTKLQEINIRRPYPFLCGLLTSGRQYQQGPNAFTMFPKEVQSHIQKVVPQLPVQGREHVRQFTGKAISTTTEQSTIKAENESQVTESSPPPNVNACDIESGYKHESLSSESPPCNGYGAWNIGTSPDTRYMTAETSPLSYQGRAWGGKGNVIPGYNSAETSPTNITTSTNKPVNSVYDYTNISSGKVPVQNVHTASSPTTESYSHLRNDYNTNIAWHKFNPQTHSTVSHQQHPNTPAIYHPYPTTSVNSMNTNYYNCNFTSNYVMPNVSNPSQHYQSSCSYANPPNNPAAINQTQAAMYNNNNFAASLMQNQPKQVQNSINTNGFYDFPPVSQLYNYCYDNIPAIITPNSQYVTSSDGQLAACQQDMSKVNYKSCNYETLPSKAN